MRVDRTGVARVLVLAVLAAGPGIATAEDSSSGQTVRADDASGLRVSRPEPVYSMGQPPLRKPYVGGAYSRRDHAGSLQTGGTAFVGVYREMLSQMWGIFGYQAEGYVGGDEAGATGGFRLLLGSRGLFLHAGVDYDVREKTGDFILCFTPNVIRGGLFRTGGWFRVDWLPSRHNSFNVGWAMPILTPHAGKTRVRKTDVTLPKGPELRAPQGLAPDVEVALGRAHRGARWIARFNDAYIDNAGGSYDGALREFRSLVDAFKDSLASTDDLHPDGHTFARELEIYHQQVERAFGAACPSAPPGAVARQVRQTLLDEVLLPYDRDIGRFKKRDSLRGLGANARRSFDVWLRERSQLPAGEQEAALQVMDRLLQILEDCRKKLHEYAHGDSRKVWLPLQYAVRPDECDTQEELDALIERAVGEPFTDGNRFIELDNQKFQRILNRSIHQAEEYHVLWIHDYRGKNAAGDPDRIGFTQTVRGYLDALTKRVEEYDRTGRMPTYIIMLDQNYYEANDGRLWMTLLEDPLDHVVFLPIGFEGMEDEIRVAQDALRKAVAGSTRLQAMREKRGKKALAELVKVHVNITNPSDLSYRNHRLLGFMPFMPDGAMIDHRKIAFWDVSEEDPGRGMGMYTGTGVGEHYSTRTWEDRAVLSQGPTMLSLRDAARRVLETNGFRPDQVPPALRPRERPSDYEQRVAELVEQGWDARTLQVHNDTGFAPKKASLVQAILYTMMPPGSVIYVPDSIWISPLWAGQLVGAALRGCHVFVIAPARDHAPAAGAPIMARTRETFARFVEIQRMLKPEMDRVGGAFHVGLYTRHSPEGDPVARLREALAGFERYPFLKEEFGLPDSVYTRLADEADRLENAGYQAQQLLEGDEGHKALIHRKTQFFGTREALHALAARPRAASWMANVFELSARVAANPDDQYGEEVLAMLRPLYDAARTGLPAHLRERSTFYFTAGSLNHDPRGFMLDGEALFIASSAWALQGYVDFLVLTGQTTWIQEQSELDALQPSLGGLNRKLGRMLENLL